MHSKVKLHLTYVRELMRKYGLSSKRTTSIHINAAGKESVDGWQRNLNRRISCLEAQEFTFVVEDESFFIRDRTEGCRYWTPVGTPVLIPYVGSHDTVTAYGLLAADGRQLFRTYDRFNAATFVEYLKSVHRCFGKIAIITDKASPHRAKLVEDLLRKNKEIKIIYLPKGSPYLNAVENAGAGPNEHCLYQNTTRQTRTCDAAYLNISERFGTLWTLRNILPESLNTS